MKFITEQNLRDLYKKEPFTTYEIADGTRLTPGGRQFLLDRGIDIFDKDRPDNNMVTNNTDEKRAARMQDAAEGEETSEVMGDSKFKIRMTTVGMDFLLAMDQISEHDICLLQQMTNIYRQLELITAGAEEGGVIPELYCKACSGISSENHSQNLGNCFAVSDFYMQMNNRRTIFLLAKLRSELEEVAADLPALLPGGSQPDIVSAGLYQVINGLSQMICAAVGGNECLRNS